LITRLRKFMTSSLFLATAAALLAAPAGAAEAENLADLLEEKGLISAEERESLADEDDAPAESAGPAEENEEVETKVDEQEKTGEKEPRATVSAGSKGLIITSADKKFQFAFGGRLQVDAGGFIQDVTPLGSGIEMRRARIKSYGYVYTDWQYKLEVNFDSDLTVPVTDAWLRYNGFKPFTVTVGHQKVPFSQQSMTSSNWQVFQERALPDAFIDNEENGRRELGVVLGDYGSHWNLHVGIFAEGVGTDDTDSEDFGAAARAVWAPIVSDGKVLAFGGSVYYRTYSLASELEFSSRPESHIAEVKLVDTGILDNGGDEILFNFDASVVCGPFHAQAEYTGVQVNRDGASDLYFYGYYAQAGWFITGESRNYDIKSGKYKRPKPTRQGLGAWEVAARWSSIDLQDRDILGGRENNFTSGVNWWINQNIMFRFNYVYGMLRPNSAEADPPLVGGIDENIHAFMARAQIVF
jgi:phosphate-selective porin OprO/OprP